MANPQSWQFSLRTIHLLEGFLPVPPGARSAYPPRGVGEGDREVLRGLWYDSDERLWLWLDRKQDRLYGPDLAQKLEWLEADDRLRIQWTAEVVVLRLAGAQLRSVVNDAALDRIWDEVRNCTGYPKPDGWRMQIHKVGNEVLLFSRSGKDWSAKFPTIVQMIRDQVEDEQVILDTELVGFDALGTHLEPSRLLYASHYRCSLLDALYLRGQSLVGFPTMERVPFILEHLRAAFNSNFAPAEYTNIHSASDLVNMYQMCRKRQKEGFDGLIIKRLDASYFSGAFKLKHEETVDAVVIGAYRNKKGEIKTLLLAVPSHMRKSWVPITKVARTNTDWNVVWHACEPHIVRERPDHVENPPKVPDIWIEPRVVVNIAITLFHLSKNYQVHAKAARGCFLREDKAAGDATSFEQVLQMADLDDVVLP